MSVGVIPLYVQTTLTTGMLISGKMSVGMRSAAPMPTRQISTNMAAMVYGRFSNQAIMNHSSARLGQITR
jgi:hypothetical protein